MGRHGAPAAAPLIPRLRRRGTRRLQVVALRSRGRSRGVYNLASAIDAGSLAIDRAT
jgi:hypothetical protein